MPSAFWKRFRAEPIPFLFFGTVVLTKVYFLVKSLFIDGDYAKFLYLLDLAASQPGHAANYLLVSGLSFIFYSVAAIAFDALVFASYLLRQKAKVKAKGFWERVYPLATVLIPVVGFTLLTIPSIRAYVPRFDLQDLVWKHQLPITIPVIVNIGGLAISALGATLSIIALWSLRRCFSLMSEIRELITTGLYRRIRHPLYMAEIIHILGIAILSATPVGIWLFVVAVAMQIVRAKIEENKFLRSVPEYAEFKNRTGFLWPKLWTRPRRAATSAS